MACERLLLVRVRDENKPNEAALRPLRFRRALAVVVQELAQLVAAQLIGAHTEDERNSVHEVRLAGPIRADDCCKVFERTNVLNSTIRLEVFHFKAVDAAVAALVALRAVRHRNRLWPAKGHQK
eukprot:362070-Chlamydomonas_euryale.AAC.22